MQNELFELYKKRFGEKFTSNLSNSGKFEIDFSKDFVCDSPNKCKECDASKFRQDLPFWLKNIEKTFMLISQDAGKSKIVSDKERDDDFNTVFSIHQVLLNKEKYLSDGKHNNYYRYLSALVPDNFIENTFFTDLIKCSYSTNGSIKIDDCKCKNDILTEIKFVKPKVVFLFGAKPRDSFKKIIKEFTNIPVQINTDETFSLKINKGKIIKISIFRHDYFLDKIFLFVPQLGNNRFSKKCFDDLLDLIKNKITPAINLHLDKNNLIFQGLQMDQNKNL
jgi:hypothetical protein